MAARGRDLQRTLGALLALDVAQVRQGAGEGRDGRLGPAQHLRALEVIRELNERAGREDLDVAARPCRFGAARGRADEALAAAVGGDRRREHAGHSRDRPVERQFAQHREAVEGIRGQGADGGHHAESDGKVVMASLLREVGRRQVDGDPLRRQGEAGGDEGGAHPFARFGHRLVGKAHDVESHIARRDLHLHIDGSRLDPLEGDGGDACNHGAQS